MKLSIIIVSWNVRERLRTNLESIFKSQFNFDFEVLVVDNNSADASVEMLRKDFPQIKIIANQKNLGFSRANNQAFKLAQGEFILLLNPDMKLQPNTLQNIVVWAENNPQAIVSTCQLISEQGKIIQQTRRFPRLLDQLLITIKAPHIFPAIIKHYLNYNFTYNQAAKVDSVRGSFFLINRFAYKKISGQEPRLDEQYFIWFEEVDFCRQVHQLGGEVWYTPVAKCFDYLGQSFSQVERKKTQQYFSDSMLKYFKKWGKHWQYFILKITWKLVKLLFK